MAIGQARAAAEAKATTPIRVVVAGSSGRMGSVLMRNLGAEQDISVVGGFRSSDPQTTVDRLLASADVMIEVTQAAATRELLLRAIAAGVRPISGTSGGERTSVLRRMNSALTELRRVRVRVPTLPP